ncbi:unnamed protein product [Durusdinium trenchii]|uniref:Clathrin adaptor alpha/beta/gamma-adaptin appendage Ig-like subdomain domain-containing protein n=1 Tax=Durusdinium trenchii TaxID=1381693 RepID=A0ABP0RA13_9DINO
MSSIVIDFEVLPEEGPSDPTAAQVCEDLKRQLQDRNSDLRRGEFGRFAENASLSVDGNVVARASESPAEVPSAGEVVYPSSGTFEPTFTSQDHQLQPIQGAAPLDPTGWENLSNSELLQSIAQRERQIVRTAIGGLGTDVPPSTRGVAADVDALESRCAHLSQRLEVAEQDLRNEKEAGRANKLRVEQLELKLKDREQLLGHAKEMWMKENVRASKLADTLTAVEDKLADQEKRLADVSARYAEAQQEVRQLQHLLGTGLGPEGGIAFAGDGFDRGARNGHSKVDDSMMVGSAGGDSSMHSPQRTLGATRVPQTENDTNTERFRRLCLMDDAVLYEDELLQIGVKAEYSGLEGQVAVFYGNKGNAALQSFVAQYLVREEHALKVVASPLNQHLEADQQIVQRLQVTMLEPFGEPPWLRLQFLLPDASPRRIQLKFPIILPKFMVGRQLSQQDFFRYWRQQHFVLNEVTCVVHLAERLRGPMVNIARSIPFGGAFRLHHGVDSNADNFVLVGSGRFAGKARVVVRSSSHVVAKALCDCLVTQLAEPQAFVPHSCSIPAR